LRKPIKVRAPCGYSTDIPCRLIGCPPRGLNLEAGISRDTVAGYRSIVAAERPEDTKRRRDPACVISSEGLLRPILQRAISGLPPGQMRFAQWGTRVYGDFFGFRELPFNNTPDPRFFYSTPDHEEALASLIYAVKERKGFVLLTGDVGAGKTLVTRLMLRHFGTKIASATLNHAVQDAADLMESICTEFEIPVESDASPTQLVRNLHDFLLTQFAQNFPVVLVLDEAQNLSVEGFEQLRMIGNLEADDAKLLQIVIVGQTELQRTFLSPQLRQLRQRVFRSYHLPAMDRETAEGYIRHRLSVVCDSFNDIFTSDAINAVQEHSRGLPRLINTLCDNALLSAYSADRRTIDEPFVTSVIDQMMTLPRSQECLESSKYGLHDPPPFEGKLNPGSTATVQAGHAGSHAETARAVQLASVLADRLDALEQRLGLAANIPASDGGSHSTPGSGDSNIRLELASLKRAVRDYAARLGERFATLEERTLGTACDSTEAATAHDAIKALLGKTRSAVLKGESVSRDLEHREQQLRKLSKSVRGVIRDLQQLMDRGHEMSATSLGAQREAQIVFDRLMAQSDRARLLADELVQLTGGVFPHDAGGTAPSLFIKAASAPAKTAGGSGAPDVPGRGELTQVQSLLVNAQTSLCELRNLAREARRGPSADRGDSGAEAATPPDGGVENPPAKTEPSRKAEAEEVATQAGTTAETQTTA